MFRRCKTKIFCIGSNKTGTTSLAAALEALGYRLGDQHRGERLVDAWARRDWQPIIDYCRSAEAFQDVPFSLDFTYVALDHAFPGAKFILTVRNSPDEWFDSLTRFHTQLIGKNRLPTADDLKAFPYNGEGWMWHAHALIFGVDEDSLYDRPTYIRHYQRRRRAVEEYFGHRPGDLLVLNVADPDAMEKLAQFLGRDARGCSMPHLNKSRKSPKTPACA
jgi:hypothetical protein